MGQFKYFEISDTSPAAASTAAGDIISGLAQFEFITIDAALVGATNGTLDVYLQRATQVAGVEVYRDWLHFPQLASGASAVKYYACSGVGNEITVVGEGTSPVLAVNTFLGGHPGDRLRALYVAGASTSAGAVVAITIGGWISTK